MLEGKITHIAPAEGGISAQVDIVDVNGSRYVLKTDTPFNIAGEKIFQQELANLHLPHVTTYNHPALQNNQLLMEFVDAEKLTGKNVTPENLARWGETLAKIHQRTFPQMMRLDENGKLQPGTWEAFVDAMIAKAAASSYHHATFHDAIRAAGNRLKNHVPASYVLCHGDMHGNNVFADNEQVFIIDNEAGALVATPHYDLAVLFGEVMPGYRYGSELSQKLDDTERMHAFLQGYGDLPVDFEDYIDDYVLLRQASRYPNPFVRHQAGIIEKILKRSL